MEPSLEELINQIKAIGGLVNDWLSEQLMSSLSSLASPDDLFNFFDKLRGIVHPYLYINCRIRSLSTVDFPPLK